MSASVLNGAAAMATPHAATEPPRMRRQNLSEEQRQQICAQRLANPKMTQQQIARWAKDEFAMQVEPSQSAISTILKRLKDPAAALAVGASASGGAGAGGLLGPRKLKKKRRVKFPKLDDALLKWVLDCDQHEIRISGELVKQKAEALCDKYKITREARPHFSNGWLASFNRRHGLKRYKRSPDYYTELGENDDDDDDGGDDDDEDEYEADAGDGSGVAARKKLATKKQSRFSGSKDQENSHGQQAPWNELTEDELAARKREADLRIEGLRYDNSLKRLKVIEENMLARKRLKDAGVSEAEIDQLMPLARPISEPEV